MDYEVRKLYLRGDARALIAIARGERRWSADEQGAYWALRLLARLGDEEAAAFCGIASGGQESGCDAA
jgi:hypothetical protein